METATVHHIKKELKHLEKEELLELCLSLTKFKKENKELMNYLLFEASDEAHYISNVKEYVTAEFSDINCSSSYLIKKSSRRILKEVKKYIRYSKKKPTEIELLTYFCKELGEFDQALRQNVILSNMYNTQVRAIEKTMAKVHEDLQYDYQEALEELMQHPCYRR